MKTADTLEIKITAYPTQAILLTLLFSLYVVSWWLEVAKRIDFLAQIRFEFLLAAALGGIAMVKLGDRKPGNPDKARIINSLILYLMALAFSLLLSKDFDISWEIFFNRVLKLSVMTLFINVFVCSPQHLWFFLISTFVAFFKVGQEGLVGKLTGYMVWENQGIMRLHGSPGTMFGHPNSLSGKTVSLLPYVWSFYKLASKNWKFLLIIQVLFSINIILFTGSRTGYLAICMLMVALFWDSKNKFKIGAVIFLLSIIAIVSMPDQYKGRFLSSFSGQEEEGRSKATRINLLKDSIEVFVENPLGVGMGCFVVMQARAGRNQQGTHNLYTQLLSEVGIQGFFAFAFFMYSVLKALRTSRIKISELISSLNRALQDNLSYPGVWGDLAAKEMRTLKLLEAVCTGTLILLFIRAVLGMFGHDLYEMYWWVASGLAIAVINLLQISEKRVAELIDLNQTHIAAGGQSEP